MKIRRAGNSSVVLLALSAAVLFIAACTAAPAMQPADAARNPGAPADSYNYTPPPPVRSFPAKNATIQGWISANNDSASRAHGWDIWQSITSATPYNQMPVWQTWISGYEIFEDSDVTNLVARSRRGVVQFGVRRKNAHPSMVSRSVKDGLPYVRA